MLLVCANSNKWRTVVFDTSPYAGQDVVLWFNAHGSGLKGKPASFLLDDVALVLATGGDAIGNGGFETGDLTSWTASGVLAPTTSPVGHSGGTSAHLGSEIAFDGNSTLAQTVVVPGGKPTLTFWYQPHCDDTITCDQIQVLLKNGSGQTLATPLNVCSNAGKWKSGHLRREELRRPGDRPHAERPRRRHPERPDVRALRRPVAQLTHAPAAFRHDRAVRLEGIHHVTCITADAPQNVEFYSGLLGLRLVKKTVNQDDPTVYHLFYADEVGSAGSDLTFFEYPGARRGSPGAGMVYRIVWRVASGDALDFWAARLGAAGTESERSDGRLLFRDPEGLELELAVVETADAPLIADHPEIPAALALQGFDSVRAYAFDPEESRGFLEEAMGFVPEGDTAYESRGEERGSLYVYDRTEEPGRGGAGTVHHIAWASPMDEHEAWRERIAAAGARPTPVIDRFYFRSIYFREPSGVLFEIATIGPGFATDEPLEHLGERLSLPPAFEHLRAQVEPVLTPLPNPRGAPAPG